MSSVENARQKARSVIEIIDSVSALDFPYEHPREAVLFIRKIFEEQLESLENISDPKLIRNICKEQSRDIDKFLHAIEFMVRACDIRGPLELQGPLLRLTHAAIGPHIKLVVSSEWRYSPSTLLNPDEFENQWVMIGLPMAEAGNPLIAPLAGHELGHNIWQHDKAVQQDIAKKVDKEVVKLISGPFATLISKVCGESDSALLAQGEILKTTSGQLAAKWAGLQCEEMFCDFIGLCIFGEAYLYAFQYLISPGNRKRNPTYPSDIARIEALRKAAEYLELDYPKELIDEFDEFEIGPDDPRQHLLLEISDEASKILVLPLIKIAEKYCVRKGIIKRDKSEVRNIFESFGNVTPATKAKSIANIINAAWQIFQAPKNPWEKDYKRIMEIPGKRFELLRELTLKSIEVFEIESIQAEFTQRN